MENKKEQPSLSPATAARMALVLGAAGVAYAKTPVHVLKGPLHIHGGKCTHVCVWYDGQLIAQASANGKQPAAPSSFDGTALSLRYDGYTHVRSQQMRDGRDAMRVLNAVWRHLASQAKLSPIQEMATFAVFLAHVTVARHTTVVNPVCDVIIPRSYGEAMWGYGLPWNVRKWLVPPVLQGVVFASAPIDVEKTHAYRNAMLEARNKSALFATAWAEPVGGDTSKLSFPAAFTSRHILALAEGLYDAPAMARLSNPPKALLPTYRALFQLMSTAIFTGAPDNDTSACTVFEVYDERLYYESYSMRCEDFDLPLALILEFPSLLLVLLLVRSAPSSFPRTFSTLKMKGTFRRKQGAANTPVIYEFDKEHALTLNCIPDRQQAV